MKFTTWQLDRLRRGLHAYRLLKAVNGRLHAWKAVHDDLLMSEMTTHVYPEDGREPDFKEEALRRFALGQSALQADKLADVRDFLIEKGVLRRDDLDGADGGSVLKDALRAHDLMASTAPSARDRITRLAPVYAASRTDMYRKTEKVELRIVDRLSETLIGFEETTRVLDEGRRSTPVVGTFVRRGYGFAMSEQPTLHVFLQGASPEDRPHYAEVTMLRTSEDEPVLNLLRTGILVMPAMASADKSTLAHAAALGVLRFEAAEQFITARNARLGEAVRP